MDFFKQNFTQYNFYYDKTQLVRSLPMVDKYAEVNGDQSFSFFSYVDVFNECDMKVGILQTDNHALYNNTVHPPKKPLLVSKVNGLLFTEDQLLASGLNVVFNFVTDEKFISLPGIYRTVSYSNTGKLFYNKKVTVKLTIPEHGNIVNIVLKVYDN